MTITIISCHPFIAGPLTREEADTVALAVETQFQNDVRTTVTRVGLGWALWDGILLSVIVAMAGKEGQGDIRLVAENIKETGYAPT